MTDEKIIEAVIDEMYKFRPAHIELFTKIKELNGKIDMAESHRHAAIIKEKLVNEGIITDEPGKGNFLTQLGLDIIEKHSGYINFLLSLKIIDEAIRERERLGDEKLRYDVKNAKRIFNTYWWTFGFSVAALLLSIFNLIYNLFFNNH